MSAPTAHCVRHQEDIAKLREVIAKVDTLQAQVLIEGVIMEVFLADGLNYGMSAGQQPKSFGGNPNVSGGGSINGNPALNGVGAFWGARAPQPRLQHWWRVELFLTHWLPLGSDFERDFE